MQMLPCLMGKKCVHMYVCTHAQAHTHTAPIIHSSYDAGSHCDPWDLKLNQSARTGNAEAMSLGSTLFICPSIQNLVVCVSVCVCVCSVVFDSVTPRAVACQIPLSMEFSRQEYSCGLPFPSPGNLPDPGMEPSSLVSPVLAGRFFPTVPPGMPMSA